MCLRGPRNTYNLQQYISAAEEEKIAGPTGDTSEFNVIFALIRVDKSIFALIRVDNAYEHLCSSRSGPRNPLLFRLLWKTRKYWFFFKNHTAFTLQNL